MALVSVKNIFLPGLHHSIVLPPASTSTVIDAAAEKFAWFGQVQTPDRGTKSIRTVGFLPGAITSAGGSTMRVSLQNLDNATTVPTRPDGTQDQTVDFLASAMTASTWYQTGNLSADRSVTHGEPLAVVIEFQSFAGADAVNLQNLQHASSFPGNYGCSHFTAAWATVTSLPNIILGFSDGTFGTLGTSSYPYASLATEVISTGSTPDEVALKFSVPFACKIDGAWVSLATNGSRVFDINLYEDGNATPLVTVTPDPEHITATSGRNIMVNFAEQTLTANTVYYLAIKPTSANNTSVYSITVSDANHFNAMPGGTAFCFASRTDAAASWTPTTTKRLQAGIQISALSDNASTGGAAGVIGS
jgi:hypothetical protein